MTRVEVLVILGIVGLLALLFVLMLSDLWRLSSRELSRRMVCASNLRGIALGMVTYANENNDYWPIAAHAPAVAEHVGRVKYAPGMIGTHRGSADNPTAGKTTASDTEMSTMRNLWTLVRDGAESTRALICPLSRDKPNADNDPVPFWDFRSYDEVSYGYQVPYGKYGQPMNNRDEKMPLLADKGPYGAALEAGASNPGVPTPTDPAAKRAWRPWNSPNHGGDGQNVAFVDSHVEFFLTPIAGVEHDNIYTRWSEAGGGSAPVDTARMHGTPPTGNETPWSDTDTLIYP